ncbi:MAG: sulfotransferase family protein [Solirubrobacteraceae bacterium]
MKRRINAALRRSGYQLTRVRGPQTAGAGPAAPERPKLRPLRHRTPRLLHEPAFVLSTVRSGSTLLRLLLDSHSEIHSPHEMHLRSIKVEITGKYGDKALAEVKLDRDELNHVLWDWYLHRELASTGKRLLVNKTPSDVWITDGIRACWPDARFIFLLRHPLAVARSRHALRPEDSEAANVRRVLKYAQAVEGARQALPGHTVRYEDLASDPVGETQKLCAFLGVEWEPSMLEYGRFAHGRLRAGLGDWKDAIRTGEVQPPKPLPDLAEVPEPLRPITAAWGYASEVVGPELERSER